MDKKGRGSEKVKDVWERMGLGNRQKDIGELPLQNGWPCIQP